MIEKKFIEAKKQEFEIKEFIKKQVGKGKVSEVRIERTPVGEKIVIVTSKPGLIIGRGGEVIQQINDSLKKKFKLENPQIEVSELQDPIFDAQTVADQIALALEKFGPLSFKLIAYRQLDRIAKAGALGAEIRLSGRLPSERAKSWRFAFGYLSKTGETKIVNRAISKAFTRPGVVGVKVAIVPKGAKIPDKIEINKEIVEEEIKEKLSGAKEEIKEEEEKKPRKRKRKKASEKKKEEEKKEEKGEEKEVKEEEK